MPFSIVNTDICRLEAEAVVNPLYLRDNIIAENDILEIVNMNIVIANRNNPYNKIIICTAESDFGTSHIKMGLYNSYCDLFIAALGANIQSVAVPLIPSGMLSITDEEILEVTIEAARSFLRCDDMDIFLVADGNNIHLQNGLSREIEQYLRNNNSDCYTSINASLPDDFCDMEAEHCALHEERKEKRNFNIFKSAKAKQCDASVMAAPQSVEETVIHIDRIFVSKEETFSRYLLRLIDESGMTDSEVYKKANIDRKHFSKIRSDENYKPKKQTVIAFAIALELDITETEKLLEKAGFALSRTMTYDLIARFFIEKKIYDMYTFECVLYQYHLV